MHAHQVRNGRPAAADAADAAAPATNAASNSPCLFQLVAQLQQLDLQLTPAVVLQDVLVGLPVDAVLLVGALAKLGHRRAAHVELVRLHMAAGARSTGREDTYTVVHALGASGRAFGERCSVDEVGWCW